MPNNLANGILENFISYLVPEKDELFEKVEGFLIKLEIQQLSKFREVHKSKAKTHNWLSLQEDPGTPLGLAITKNYLDSECKDAAVFIKWLQRLIS